MIVKSNTKVSIKTIDSRIHRITTDTKDYNVSIANGTQVNINTGNLLEQVGVNTPDYDVIIKEVPGGDLDPFDGNYVVTPKVASDITLETKGKRMKDDVTVKEVPYWEVSNTSGGSTFVIGGK